MLPRDEEWRAVVGYEGLYEVSDLGRVRSLPRKTATGLRGGSTLTPRHNKSGGKSGYLHVALYDAAHKSRHHYLHKLVLEAFVGPRPDGMEARHFPDNNKANCRAENLSWATHVTNAHDKGGHGTLARGETHAGSKLTDDAVRAIRLLRRNGVSCRKIAAQYAVSCSLVHLVVSHKTWTHVQ